MAELKIISRDGGTKSITLGNCPITLGRAPENDLPYPADGVLSRKHVTLMPLEGAWYVEDLGSKNGTLLNNERLKARRQLNPGDRIDCGAVSLVFEPAASRDQTGVFVPEATQVPTSAPELRLTLGEIAGNKDQLDASLTAKSTTGLSRVQTLLEAGRELAGHRPLNDLFPLILGLAMRAVSAARGVVLILEKDKLVPRAAIGEQFQISSSVRDMVMDRRESLLIRDASHDSVLRNAQSIVASRVKSLMAVPLQTSTNVIGLIYVDSPDIVRPFAAEDLHLLTVLANVAAVRIEHARLIEIEQDDLVLHKELDQAAEIQKSFFPRETPVVPGFSLAGLSLPCRSVGGDFFDYLQLPQGLVGVLLGDVAGKGLPAALLMSSLMARVQVLAEVTSDPAELVTRLNRIFALSCPANRFVTFFLLVLDPATGEFTYCNAGHNPPYLRRASGEIEQLADGGPVVGVLKKFTYHGVKGQLNAGDSILLYSDGVTEARSPLDEEFGEERLEAMIRECPGCHASELLRRLHLPVEMFMSTAPSADDLTMVVLRRDP